MLDDATRPSTPAALILFAVLLAAAAWWGGLSPALQPPPVQPESAPAADFSAQRARRHLQVIAGQPRPLGSAAHARARDHIVAALRELGLEPHLQHETVLHGAGARLAVVPVANVMARLPGSRRQAGGDPGPAVVLMAHYDSVPHSPGVNDAGNGVAAVLETLRALRAGPVLQNDVIALFTDAEEVGLFGARAWQDHPWAADAGVVLNAEGRGRGGAVYMFRSVGDNGGMVRTLARAVPRAMADSLAAALFDLMPNDTDLSVFAAAGIPGLDFANIRGLSHYHTALDNLEQADPRSLQHHGDYLLPLARAFAEQDLRTLAEPRRVFFPAPGLGLVHYPASWALPLALLVTGLLLVLAVRRHRQGHWRLSELGLGLAHLLAALLLLPLLAALAWQVISPVLPELAGFRHGSPYDGQRYLPALALPVVALYLAWLAWLCRRVRPPGLALAVLFTWCLAALASAVWLPGGSWFFLWPLALALAGWALLPLARRTLAGALAGVVATVLVPLLVIALMTPMLLGQDEAMGMAAAPFTLALVIWVLALLLPALALVLRPRPMAFLAPGLLALAGIGVLAWALSVAGIDAQRPLPENLEYIADPGRGEALWVSTDATPGPWARRHLGDDARRAPLPDWLPPLPSAADTAWQSAAPVLRDDAPDLQLLSETLHDDGLRQLRLRLLGPAGGHATVLGLPPDVPVTGLRIDGRPAPAGLAGQGLEITWYAVPGEGAEVELSVPAGAPLLLRLRSNIPGLPADAAGRGDEPPPHSMPAGPWTGRTRLLRTVTL